MGIIRNIILVISLVTMVQQVFAAEHLFCKYTNHDNSQGEVIIKIKNSKIELEFKSIKVAGELCSVRILPTDISVECEEDGNAIGLVLNLKGSRFEGVLISEKAAIFGHVDC